MSKYNFIMSGHPGERDYINQSCGIKPNDCDTIAINKIYNKLFQLEQEIRELKDMKEIQQ